MNLERYAVLDNPDDPADYLYDTYEEAKHDAERRGACVVAYIFEYADSELVDDFRSAAKKRRAR